MMSGVSGRRRGRRPARLEAEDFEPAAGPVDGRLRPGARPLGRGPGLSEGLEEAESLEIGGIVGWRGGAACRHGSSAGRRRSFERS